MAVPGRKLERQVSESSVDSLKTLNEDLRTHLAKLRSQLDLQKGNVKQVHWQKVLDIRMVREQEQQKYMATIADLQTKLLTEKSCELENQREQLQQKHEHDLQKFTRMKDTEITKLRHELEQKESLLHRYINETRRESLRLSQDGRKSKLLNELSDLRSTKKQLEDSLTSASEAERQYCRELRKTAEHYQSEVVRVKREAYIEIRHLIEQLKNKDKIISHLERELGHQSGYALHLALERESTSHDASPHPATLAVTPNMDLSLSSSGSNGKLGDGSGTRATTYTLSYEGEGKRAIEDLAHLETEVQELNEKCDCLVQDNQELSKKLKDIEQKNRQLNEKNKKFLDKNVELTSFNRNLKDQTQLLTEDHKKLNHQYEHSRRKCQQLMKQLQQERCDLSCAEEKVLQMEGMKQQLTEQGKSIAALKQACSEKDRRIELIQHRKKRRRLMRSQEKCTGVKETFYGYDEDSRSENSENSLSSVSLTISDDDLWDELTREEVEKNYQRLMREHQQLQKSHALLQSQTDGLLDPQREAKMRSQLEMDLFKSQCRIEELEKLLQDTGQGEACEWVREKEKFFTSNEELRQQVQVFESETINLQQDLSEKTEQIEDLEFRILELEECAQPKVCECGGREVTPADSMSRGPLEVEALQGQLKVLLQGKGKEADTVLKKLDKLKDAEQQIINLECTAKELQAKVISLQQEKTTLEEMLLSTQQGTAPSPNRHESVEVLALKDQLVFHEKSEVELMEKNIKLQTKLEECESQNCKLLRRIDELEDTVVKLQTKHGKPMNRTDSEKEKFHEKLIRTNSVGSDSPSKRDKNSQTYTKMLDKSVTAKYEELVKHTEADFDVLDQKMQILYEENLSLQQQLVEKKIIDEESDKSLDMSYDSRLAEMEEYCEDLQDRLHTAEMSERQLREKLKLAEHTINDLESSENYCREKVEELTNRESEAKRQTCQLYHTVQELKEIVLDKDVIETALREKVDFLEKAELASAQIIQELQNSEKSLRHQLELKSDIEGDVRFAERLKGRISVLEKDNKKLSVKVSELEEDEEVLRENWRRVADEDANRIECLEEKVKMLEAMNKQLKNSLQDAQDNVYIHNNVPQSSSLATELSESERNNGELTLAKRSFSTPFLHSAGYEVSMPQRSLSQRDLDFITESEGFEKIQELEEQINNIVEDKNSKIENLHEKIANLHDNEVKLTETLVEMEQEERELKAKIALYESKAVTVEKMLQYEDKIMELHSSQENLLDRLESMEDHEMTLQEKLDLAEQQTKIKVGTLEKQLKNVHAQLEQAKTRGEELVKEKEFLKKQIDKLENKIRLYVKKGEEAKEKVTELSGQINVYEQREEYASGKLKEMEETLSAIQEREEGLKARISELESEIEVLHQREEKAKAKLVGMKDEMKKLEQKDSHSSARIVELEKHEKELVEKVCQYAKRDSKSKQKISELESQMGESASKSVVLERELAEAKENDQARLGTIKNMEKAQTELSESLKKMRVCEDRYVQQISTLEQTKSVAVAELEKEKHALLEKIKKLEMSVREQVGSVKYLEQKLSQSQGCERTGAEKMSSLETTLADYEEIVVRKTSEVKELQKEKLELSKKVDDLVNEGDQLEDEKIELKDQVWNLQQEKNFLESQLNQLTGKEDGQRAVLESLRASLNQLQETNKEYETQVRTLSCDVESFEQKNRSLSSEMDQVLSLKSELEKNIQILSEQVSSLEKENQDLRTQVSNISSEKEEIQSSLDRLTCDIDFLNGVVGDLKFSVKTLENEKSELKSECETAQTECYDLKQKLSASKSFDEQSEKKTKVMSQDMETLENAKKELLKSVLSLENEKHNILAELEKTKSECESANVKLNESCENEKNLRDKLTVSEEKLLNHQKREKELEDEVSRLTESVESVQSELDTEKSSLENVEDIVKERDQLQEHLQQLHKDQGRMSQKMEVLQDAETKLMDRVMELEQVEQDLQEKLETSSRLSREGTLCSEMSTITDVSSQPDMSDQSTSTCDLVGADQPVPVKKVSGIFQRLQELETENKDMSIKLHDYDSATTQAKQMKDKVKLLERSEDKLMERVMELEECEDRLRGEVQKLRSSSSVDESDSGREVMRQASTSAESDTSALITYVEQLKEEKSNIETLLDEEKENVEKVAQEKMILQEELLHLTESVQEEKQTLEDKVKTLERLHQKEQFKVDSLQSSEFVLKKDLETLKQEKKTVEDEMNDLQSQVIDFQTQIVDLENQLQEERHMVEIVTDKKISLEKKMQSLEETVSQQHQQSKTYASVEDRLLKSMTDESSVLKDLEKELRTTQVKLAEVQTEYEKKISDVQSQNQSPDQSEKHVKSAINANVQKEQELQEQIETLQSEISEICDKSKQLEDRVIVLQSENSSLVLKCDSLTKDNEKLCESVKTLREEGDPKKKSSTHHPVLPKITSLATASPRSKDILKKPLPFGANKSVQFLREKDLQSQVTALESKQKELLDTIGKLERENAKLKDGSSSTSTSTLYLTPASKKYGGSRYSGTKESSSEELLQKVHKLEEEKEQGRRKVEELEKYITAFKAEVTNLRDFIVEGEKKATDTFHMKPKPMSPSVSLHHMAEISNLEVELRRKMAEIQHREQTVRSEVSPVGVEKLRHQVIELQASEARLKQKVVDLQLVEDDLKKKLKHSDRSARPASVPASKCDGNHAEFFHKIDTLKKREEHLKQQIERLEQDAKNQDLSRKVDQLEQSEKSLKRKVERLETSQVAAPVATETADTMLDKPEDVLLQQIRELEKLDKHHREQISELEADREELHEIARRDKATIHDQNVRNRELQLSEKVLREQVEKMEAAETELYRKCEDLDSQNSKMEDQTHLLQIHERRLRELVKKLKLDEELWIAKSENMEMTVEELAASEVNLRKRLEELATEKMTLAQKSEYLRLRCQELESSETALYEKVKNYENVEVSLQNKLMVLENSEAAANSKISELDMMNMDISTRLQRAVEENAVLYNHIQGIQGNVQELNRQLLVAKDSELSLKQQVESSEKNEVVLQKRLKEFELRDIDSQAKVRQLEQTEAIMKDRISNLHRSENKLKYRIQELESTGKQSLDGVSREKLPRTLDECHKRIVVLQNQLKQTAKFSDDDDDGAIVKVPKMELAQVQAKMVLLEESERQLSETEKLVSHLQDTVAQLRQGKGSCGHEVELDVCRKRIESYENILQRLKQILPPEQVPSLLNPDSDPSVQGSSSENLPARGLQSLESERVMQTMRGLTRPVGSAAAQPQAMHAEDQVPSDLSSVDEENMHQVQGSRVYTRPRVSASQDGRGGHLESSDAESVMEEQWKRIESKKPRLEKKADMSGNWKSVAKTVPSTSLRKNTDSQEELMIGLTLNSESEHSHYRSQNDTDSNRSSPQLHRARASKDASFESHAPPLPKSLPPSLPQKVGNFAEKSYYLPSSELNTSADETQRSGGQRVPHQQTAPPVSAQVTRTVSAESVADSGQGTLGTGSMFSTSRGSVIRDRIAQLERQLQSKSSGAESRTDEEDSVFSWKQKALEKPRHIEIIEKENKNVKDEINKLEKELEEKRRHIDTFTTWMSDAEELLRNQNKHSDRDIVQNLQSHLVSIKSQLQHSGYRKEDILEDPAAFKTELYKRDREIATKTSEIETLTVEVLRWKEECDRTEKMRANALDSLRNLEVEVTHLENTEEQLKELKEEYNQLREQMERVEQLKQELVHLQDRMADIDKENSHLKTMQDDYHTIKSRYEEVERLKNKAVMAISPLKAQVTRLSRKCREKDALIHRLAEELKRCQTAENLASVLEELEQFEQDTENEEYYRPLSPYTQANRADSPRAGKIDVNSFIRNQRNSGRWSSSSSLSDSRDLSSDTEIGSVESANKRRPKSADHLMGRRSPFQGILQRSINANNLSPRGSGGLVHSMREKYGHLPDASHFVAITDYIPDALSNTGHPSLQLRLQEGDKVKVTGPIDENGYYEVECNGRAGLVPATCLQPAGLGSNGHHGTPKERRLKHLKNQPAHQDNSPERVTEMYHQLQAPHISPRHGGSSSSSSRSTPTSSHAHHGTQTPKHLVSSSSAQTRSHKPMFKTAPRSGPPEAPRQFHVERLVGETGVMLSWIPPDLDEVGCSNNSQVVGYRIFLNGRLCQQPSSPHLAKSVVENIDQNQHQHFSLQTVSSAGQTSTLVETVYKPTDLPRCGGSENEAATDTDLSSILSSRHYDQGQKRLFMGVYDYDPRHHSPHDYTGYELAFRAGDVIEVFGQLRPDGFYHGQISGKRGLVPASFLEEVPPPHRPVTSGSSSNLHTPRSTNSTLRRTPRS
ncbi:centrosome-associated protein CEP250-like isoform X1 [Haliotis cracherodii]|uniref:centrosome-associated protein CEP250-like isoform X1 n=3 Tax=Haliotis cracherodii TaxID=6455 RepID=UPI0039ECB876